jgi:hypothetical protein
MLMRIVAAIAVGIGTSLICLLIGLVLVALNVPIVEAIGSFLRQYAWLIGAVTGLFWFATGRTWTVVP